MMGTGPRGKAHCSSALELLIWKLDGLSTINWAPPYMSLSLWVHGNTTFYNLLGRNYPKFHFLSMRELNRLKFIFFISYRMIWLYFIQEGLSKRCTGLETTFCHCGCIFGHCTICRHYTYYVPQNIVGAKVTFACGSADLSK